MKRDTRVQQNEKDGVKISNNISDIFVHNKEK